MRWVVTIELVTSAVPCFAFFQFEGVRSFTSCQSNTCHRDRKIFIKNKFFTGGPISKAHQTEIIEFVRSFSRRNCRHFLGYSIECKCYIINTRNIYYEGVRFINRPLCDFAIITWIYLEDSKCMFSFEKSNVFTRTIPLINIRVTLFFHVSIFIHMTYEPRLIEERTVLTGNSVKRIWIWQIWNISQSIPCVYIEILFGSPSKVSCLFATFGFTIVKQTFSISAFICYNFVNIETIDFVSQLGHSNTRPCDMVSFAIPHINFRIFPSKYIHEVNRILSFDFCLGGIPSAFVFTLAVLVARNEIRFILIPWQIYGLV